MERGYPVTCEDVGLYANLPNGRWPWYVRLALLFRPTHTVMDTDGIFGYKYDRLNGRTYIVGQVSNYVTPERFR